MSDSAHDRFSGRVFLGVDNPGPSQTTVLELEGKKHLVWDESVDTEFLARVQERARVKAKSILSEAMQQAGVEREIARKRGYDEGMQQAQDEVAAFMQAQSEAVAALLDQIRAQAMAAWRAQAADMTALVRLAVEKTLRVELSERRGEVLSRLLDEAMERLGSQRRLTVRVAPADAEAVTAMIEAAKPRYPVLVHFKVKPDPRMDAGVV
ncbi:MAG: FliH/SctL family protein, partial [Desulfovibrionaceae bacterium]